MVLSFEQAEPAENPADDSGDGRFPRTGVSSENEVESLAGFPQAVLPSLLLDFQETHQALDFVLDPWQADQGFKVSHRCLQGRFGILWNFGRYANRCEKIRIFLDGECGGPIGFRAFGACIERPA